MVEAKILTKHPQDKKGVNLSKAKYDILRAAILKCLDGNELSQMQLTDCVTKALEGGFEGAVQRYTEAVKLDLEA